MDKPHGERLAAIENELINIRRGQEVIFREIRNSNRNCRSCRENLIERINRIRGSVAGKVTMDYGTLMKILLVVLSAGGGAGIGTEIGKLLLGG